MVFFGDIMMKVFIVTYDINKSRLSETEISKVDMIKNSIHDLMLFKNRGIEINETTWLRKISFSPSRTDSKALLQYINRKIKIRLQDNIKNISYIMDTYVNLFVYEINSNYPVLMTYQNVIGNDLEGFLEQAFPYN